MWSNITILYIIFNGHLLQHFVITSYIYIFVDGTPIAVISDIFKETRTINFIFSDKGDHE